MHLPIRTLLAATLLLGASVLPACDTYKKAPGEEDEGTGTASATNEAPAAASATNEAAAAKDSKSPQPSAPGAGNTADKTAPGGKPTGVTGGGAACAAVADNVIKVAMSQPNLAPEQLARMKQLEARQRQVITQTCDSIPWPREFRDCLARATSTAEIQGCRKFEPGH